MNFISDRYIWVMKLQYSQLNDDQLIQHLISGDRSALDQIYIRHSEFLFQYAYKRVGSMEDVSDLIQDLFLKLWVKRISLDIKSSLRAYLLFCLRNIIIDKYHHKIVRTNHTSSISSTLNNECNATEELVGYNDLQRFLEIQINKLPIKMQTIFILRKLEDLSIDEVAERLNLSKQTIKNQLNSALIRLRVSFENYFILLFLPLLILFL